MKIGQWSRDHRLGDADEGAAGAVGNDDLLGAADEGREVDLRVILPLAISLYSCRNGGGLACL